MLSFKNNSRQVLVITIMILVPCLTLGYYLFYENARSRVNDEKMKNTELAKITTQYIDTYIRSVKNTLKSFSSEINYLDNPTELQQTLKNLRMHDDAESYFVLDPKGNTLAIGPYEEQLRISKEILNTAYRDGFVVELLEEKNPVRVAVIAPIISKNYSVVGYAGAIINLDMVARDFANIKVSNNGYAIMIDAVGHILIHPQSDKIRQKIPPEKMKTDPIYQAASRGVPGAIEITAPFDGKKKLFAFAQSHETKWIILLVEPETDLQVLISKNYTRNIVVFLMVLLVMSLLYQYLKMLSQKSKQEEVIRSEKLALVGQLAAGMAHEIRNPLTSVKGFLQLIIEAETDPKKRKHQDIMLSEIERIEEIITETLLLAKPQKQKVLQFSIGSLVKQVVSVLSGEATLKNIFLDVNVSSDTLMVSGDPNYLKQAVINVVKNAIEASNEGGIISVSAYEKGDTAFIEVQDQGSGIDPGHASKLGTPFFTTKDEGTGLGLMITQRIVDSMHGSLEIMSKPGLGTTVTMGFPILKE